MDRLDGLPAAKASELIHDEIPEVLNQKQSMKQPWNLGKDPKRMKLSRDIIFFDTYNHSHPYLRARCPK